MAPHSVLREPQDERATVLEGLFRPVVVAAFHMGAKTPEVRAALERAMRDIFRPSSCLNLIAQPVIELSDVQVLWTSDIG